MYSCFSQDSDVLNGAALDCQKLNGVGNGEVSLFPKVKSFENAFSESKAN